MSETKPKQETYAERIHSQVQLKLRQKSHDFWSNPINTLNDEETSHVKQCGKCQELWGLRKSQTKLDLPISPWIDKIEKR